eukprot:Em0003g1394a
MAGLNLVGYRRLQYWYESFNSTVHLQNIYGKKQAPSRILQITLPLLSICNGGYYDSNERCSKGLQDLYSSDQVQSFFNSVPSKALKANLDISQAQHRWQLPTMVHSMHSRSTVLQFVEQYKNLSSRILAVVSQSSELVHSGDYVKLHPPFCQFTYGQLVATIKPKSEHTLCLVQGFEPFKLSNGQQCLNNVEHCSL